MTIAILLLAWWAAGAAAMTYVMQPVQKWTWGDLATAVAFGWIGPLLPAAVLLKIVIEAKFWKRRIFPNRRI